MGNGPACDCKCPGCNQSPGYEQFHCREAIFGCNVSGKKQGARS